MIKPTDKSYIETKLIKTGRKKLNPDFLAFAKWIKETFNHAPLNIIYDNITTPNNIPRLEIVFEFSIEVERFIDSRDLVNFDVEKQSIILNQFKQLYSNKYEMDNLFVIFSAFEPIAKEEAVSKINKKEIAKLVSQISSKGIWEISRCFSSTTFFLFTDKQVEEAKKNNLQKIWSGIYFKLLKKYDEFGYFDEENFLVSLDSKENFDKNYKSNWFNYYR